MFLRMSLPPLWIQRKFWFKPKSHYSVMDITCLPWPEYIVDPPESCFHGTPHRLPENGQQEGQEDTFSSCLLCTQVCSIVSSLQSQNTDSKIMLPRGSRRQQQSIKPNTESFWTQDPMQWHRLYTYETSPTTEKPSSSALGKRNWELVAVKLPDS